jgi:hypothetical protein
VHFEALSGVALIALTLIDQVLVWKPANAQQLREAALSDLSVKSGAARQRSLPAKG